ncbi:uncharacterized protein LOC117644707 [Thrips palmi]|uniref:Uncharacterized protein LOC117644707 n=1 Tax=Thrips palmi TaxID=161013 RepID=A0A6P8Z0W5_THRPL|nr:uncharacterized protein LOC117644707 [Thrips palmi]
MCFREGLLVAVLVLALEAVLAAQLSYTAHPGLHYRHVHRVLATSAALTNFTMDLRPPAEDHTAALVAQFKEALQAITREDGDKAPIYNVTDLILDLSQRLDGHYDATKLAARLTTPLDVLLKHRVRRRRGRRFLSSPFAFIGDFLSSCCGVGSYNDIGLLRQKDLEVVAGLNAVKEDVKTLRDAQVQTRNAMADLVQQVNNKTAAVVNSTGTLVANLGRRVIQLSLQVATIAVLETDKLLNTQRMQSIHAACAAGLIPLEAVPPSKLLEAVEEVEEKLSHREALAVPSLELLYKLEIATCVFSGDDRLAILVKLPLVPVDEQRWRAYDVLPLGFLHGAGGAASVCRLLPREVMVAVSESGALRIMTPQQRASCLDGRVCEVPRLAEAPGVSRACVQGVWQLRDAGDAADAELLDKLRGVCSFTCSPYRGAEVTHLQNNLYSVVNNDADLALKCGDEYTPLSRTPVGSLIVEVPCRCELRDVSRPDDVLVASVVSCHSDLPTTPVVNVTVPAMWTNYKSKLAALLANSSWAATLVDANWTKAIKVEGLDLSIALKTEAEWPKRLDSLDRSTATAATRFKESKMFVKRIVCSVWSHAKQEIDQYFKYL